MALLLFAADHEKAESLYKQLSFFPGIGDFYYGVSLGQVDEFGTVLEVLANQITQQVLATTNGVPPLPLSQRDEEEQTQLAQLQELNCDYGQGFYFSRPLSPKEASKILESEPEWLKTAA